MLYSDNQFKFVAVLNRKVPLPQLLNALGHLAVAMQAVSKDAVADRVHDYLGADNTSYAKISHWPFIVLQANNGNQLRTLRSAALAAGMPCQSFVDAMLGSSADDQIQKTKATADDAMEYMAVLLFGQSDALRDLTRKFSLFNQPATNTYGSEFHTLDPH